MEIWWATLKSHSPHLWIWNCPPMHGALWDMGLTHCGICESSQFKCLFWTDHIQPSYDIQISGFICAYYQGSPLKKMHMRNFRDFTILRSAYMWKEEKYAQSHLPGSFICLGLSRSGKCRTLIILNFYMQVSQPTKSAPAELNFYRISNHCVVTFCIPKLCSDFVNLVFIATRVATSDLIHLNSADKEEKHM